ncbi:TetR/AcrR family transcriptional regulator [soil metagenome]
MSKPSTTRGFARERVLEAALELFAKHGVHGTSLQMIADRLGVGKGAVYYQFQSKDEIALAVVRPVFEDIEHLIRIAELLPTPQAQRDVAISGLVELAIRHRRVSSLFYGDATIQQLVEAQDDIQAIFDRFSTLLLGPDPDTATRVAISMTTAGIYACATDPALADITDEDLRPVLLDCSKRCVKP